MTLEQRVQITAANLRDLAAVARRNGTTEAFCELALQWVDQADAEIDRLRAAQAQRADVQVEPVMTYHGRHTIDCGEFGSHDMEMHRLIPAGTKLYAHPDPAVASLTARVAELEAALQPFVAHNSSDENITITVPTAAVTAWRAALRARGV